MKIEKKKLKEFRDDRGSLVPMEIEKVIDFVPKRLFYVTGVPRIEKGRPCPLPN